MGVQADILPAVHPDESFSKIADEAKQTRVSLAGDSELERSAPPKMDETNQLADNMWHSAMQVAKPVVSEEEIKEGSKIELKPEESSAKDNAVMRTLAKIRGSHMPELSTVQTEKARPV